MLSKIYIVNLMGEKEPLSVKKIYRSARRAGASKLLARKAMEIIEKEAWPGMTSSQIYDRIKQIMREETPAVAMKFSLKNSLRKLGPSGFPFEKYIAAILEKNGYWVQINQMIRGYCVEYEIDFLAKKDKNLFIGECKYHNILGIRTDLKVALANQARFADIQLGAFLKKKEFQGLKIRSLLVTNTKFSEQAVIYAKCVGNILLGWGYPATENLQWYIENQKLYPITILPSLKEFTFNVFASQRLMLAEDLLKIDPIKFAKANRLPLDHLQDLIREAKTLLLDNNSLIRS